MSSFAGVVVLYHPNESVCDNIRSYVNELDILYVLDNTENPDVNGIEQILTLPNVEYVPFRENKGLSYALNFALDNAQEYTYLLTMDQDSCFVEENFLQYKRNIIQLENDGRFSDVAIFAVNYSGLKEAENAHGIYEVMAAITSGSILKIQLAKRIGNFDDNLFIDEVDNEYCYRTRKLGYKVVMNYDIKLVHHLGNPQKYCIFGYNFTILNHSPIRKYYIFRNRLYVAKKYKTVRTYCAISLVKIFIKVLFFESDKFAKFRYMFKGIQDFLLNRYGKYPEQS